MKDNKIFDDKIFKRNLSIQQRKKLLEKGLNNLYNYIIDESDKFTNINQQHYLMKYSYGILINEFIRIEKKMKEQKRLARDWQDLRRKNKQQITNNNNK